MKQNISQLLIPVGMLMILAGIIIPLVTLNIHNDTFRVIYAVGAVMLLAGRILNPYTGDNVRVKRLARIETWSALFFCVGAFLLFYDKSMMRDPITFTLCGAIIQIYTSIMIPRISK